MSGDAHAASTPQALAAAIKTQARSIGFDSVGITDAQPDPVLEKRLRAFLTDNHHGTMAWMQTRIAERANPRTLWPQVRSIIMLGMNYGPDADPLKALAEKDKAVISVYAQNRDYHDVVKKRLKDLARWMVATHGGTLKVFVDTAPVMEKPLAARAGLGWQGKHTNLVARDYGSWLFLGAIFTTLDLAVDSPEPDHCGQCTACLDICPTKAFPAPYKLDARRCISYLTIEHKGMIPEPYRAAMGNRIYGCDDCLAVCPWNKFARQARETKLKARDDLKAPDLGTFLTFDDARFRTHFSGSPIKRIGRNRFVRNVLIAVGNSGNENYCGAVHALTTDPDRVVAQTAQWALAQLKKA
ncbi:MAG: tRNA epoxyqueuosine(34) reductase QueG [Pseudomonadota bacterium]